MNDQTGACCPSECCEADTNARVPALRPPDEQRLSELCRALAHPARVHILGVLLAKNVCVAGELAGQLPLAASTVSEHLRVLKACGLIKGEIDGPRRCYCANRALLDEFKQLVGAL
ncbi:MAG: metalloregulator ArsR/SmtB family transcription factor [Myxococcales bacterium]|nr:metalloregulator ArsR/SmtB family transcription factor [Myxococcales bacterium]